MKLKFPSINAHDSTYFVSPTLMEYFYAAAKKITGIVTYKVVN